VFFYSVHNCQCFNFGFVYEIKTDVGGYLGLNDGMFCMAVCVILSRYNMTPLMYAARQGLVTVVELLLSVTTDVNFQDNKGFTVCYVQCTLYNELFCWILNKNTVS